MCCEHVGLSYCWAVTKQWQLAVAHVKGKGILLQGRASCKHALYIQAERIVSLLDRSIAAASQAPQTMRKIHR
jgi:hypothetical protein